MNRISPLDNNWQEFKELSRPFLYRGAIKERKEYYLGKSTIIGIVYDNGKFRDAYGVAGAGVEGTLRSNPSNSISRADLECESSCKQENGRNRESSFTLLINA